MRFFFIKLTASFGSVFICNLSSMDSSLLYKLNLYKLSLADPSHAVSMFGGSLYSKITEFDITYPSQATCNVAKPAEPIKF